MRAHEGTTTEAMTGAIAGAMTGAVTSAATGATTDAATSAATGATTGAATGATTGATTGAAGTTAASPSDLRALSRVTAHATIAHHSKSFSLAAKILPPASRDDAAVLYTYCRRVDDAVDEVADEPAGDASTTTSEAASGGATAASSTSAVVSRLHAELDGLYAGAPSALADPVLGRLAAIIAQRHIPRHYPAELIAGMEMDVDGTHYETTDQLVRYAYRVAGVVGLMMCHVLGVRDDRALMPAVHLGIAMQLTNICRDVGEDWGRGRLYVPAQLLARHGGAALPQALRQGAPLSATARPALAAAMRDLLELADRYYRSADRGMPALPWRCALGVRAARGFYAAIGDRVAAAQWDPLAPRAFVPPAKKLRLVGAAALYAVTDLPRRVFSRATYRPPTTTLEFSDVERF
jgi:15-cis-phytoene synthase